MKIESIIQKSIEVKQKILADSRMIDEIQNISNAIVEAYQRNGKVLLCGNGGSAADAQHLAAEFSGRFYYDRKPLFAEALHVNTSYLTAVANDYSFEVIYSRLTEAFGQKGDILWSFSTSGNSPNVIKALETARSKGMLTIGFTGQGGGKMLQLCDYLIAIPSTDTPRVQEAHIMIGHIICELVESTLFPR